MNLSSDFGHWVPLREIEAPGIQAAHEASGLSNVAVWANDVYEVFAHAYAPGQVHLSIKRYDRRPIRNWRHFQQIKNEICGDESEGVELYPSESRLADNANQYHLWVMLEPQSPPGALEGPNGVRVDDLLIIPRDPESLRIAVGFPDGKVTTDEQAERLNEGSRRGEHGAKQEPWQPGLTTGRTEQTQYASEDDMEILDRSVEAAKTARHAHDWIPSGSYDTGTDPRRQRWDCDCGESEWTADPRGPEGDE
jgi:hypothetical protein